jgi:hypothetical protein
MRPASASGAPHAMIFLNGPVGISRAHSRERVGELPPGVTYMPKPWQPLNVLIAAKQALASQV